MALSEPKVIAKHSRSNNNNNSNNNDNNNNSNNKSSPGGSSWGLEGECFSVEVTSF